MDESSKRHPIRVVARRTGTTETTLRAWERRYGAVHPARADTGRRLYSDRDIERLNLIRLAVDSGRSVSSVASMPDRELRRLVEEDQQSLAARREMVAPTEASSDVVEDGLRAVLEMDAQGLASRLRRAALNLPLTTLIEEVITPLFHRIGAQWRSGRLGPRHERLASSIVRTVLAQLQVGGLQPEIGTIVVGTPPGQMHDLGTVFVSTVAAAEGWAVVNLGADVPASDIASAAREVRADVVALSIVHPPDDPRVHDALSYLGEHLGRDVRLVVGGRGIESYRDSVEKAGGIEFRSMRDLSRLLARIHG